jgi:hypothetical protein
MLVSLLGAAGDGTRPEVLTIARTSDHPHACDLETGVIRGAPSLSLPGSIWLSCHQMSGWFRASEIPRLPLLSQDMQNWSCIRSVVSHSAHRPVWASGFLDQVQALEVCLRDVISRITKVKGAKTRFLLTRHHPFLFPQKIEFEGRETAVLCC